MFVPHGSLLPTIIRAKLPSLKLLTLENLKWDAKLSSPLSEELRNIAEQFNASADLQVPRCVGDCSGEYVLMACTDAAKESYGMVLYLMDCIT